MIPLSIENIMSKRENTHYCKAPGCKQKVDNCFLMCHKHWYMVPREIRNEIWRTYQPMSWGDLDLFERYVRATEQAIESIHEGV